MGKRVIQIPVEEELLKSLDGLAKKQQKTRSELIRQACRRYVRQVELEEMDRAYERGYKKTPEKLEIGETQIAVAGKVLPAESW